MVRSQKFLEDYGKTFKEKVIVVGGVDIRDEIEKILSEFGIL